MYPYRTHMIPFAANQTYRDFFFFFQDGENADFRHDDALYDSFPFDRLSMSQREIGEDVNSYIREYNL